MFKMSASLEHACLHPHFRRGPPPSPFGFRGKI